MSGFELNKIFAAVLVAGIVAMLSGFIAELLMHPHELETDAVAIEGADLAGAGGGAAVEAMPEPILHLIAAADVAQGEKLSKACAACHSFQQGEPAKIGPNLWETVGAAKAGHSGFEYSEALKAKGGTWSYADLNHFLWKPKKFVEGTKMNYIGLKKPEDRAAMIAWLRTLSSAQAPLPSQGEIDAEAAELAPPSEEKAVEAGATSGADPEDKNDTAATPAAANKALQEDEGKDDAHSGAAH